jgi:hypothetical protein
MIRQFSKLMVMANRNPLMWKLKLTAELAPGECIEYDVGASRGSDARISRPEPGRSQSHARRDPDPDGDCSDRAPETDSSLLR